MLSPTETGRACRRNRRPTSPPTSFTCARKRSSGPADHTRESLKRSKSPCWIRRSRRIRLLSRRSASSRRSHFEMYWNNHDHTPARLDLGRTASGRCRSIAARRRRGASHPGPASLLGQRGITSRALAELALARRTLAERRRRRFLQRRHRAAPGPLGGIDSPARKTAVRIDPRNATTLAELATTNYVALRRYEDAARVCDDVHRHGNPISLPTGARARGPARSRRLATHGKCGLAGQQRENDRSGSSSA